MDIDFVVPWVDGADPEWMNEKAKFSPISVDDSNSDTRFQDLGLMKYWFRSIEKFTPWFRKVHFVTCGHLPDFLNVDHPKLNIVRHTDYIPSEWLPTFSSHTIEMNMHRIKGLSDHFVYFNDDTFILKSLPEEYFFRRNTPCAYVAEVPLGFIGKPETWSFAAANGLGIINAHFNKKIQEKKHRGIYVNRKYSWYDNLRTLLLYELVPSYYTGFKNFHCPAAFNKRTFDEIWEREKATLELTSSHKFRDKEDVNQWVAQWWQIASGNVVPRRTKAGKFTVNPETAGKVAKAVLSGDYEMISISSVAVSSDSTEVNPMCEVERAFDQLLPEKSTFER